MADPNDVWNWDVLAGGNSFLFPEGMEKQDLNDGAREQMAAVARMLRDFPWLSLTIDESYVQLGDFQFRVTGVDVTDDLSSGRMIKVSGTGPTVIGKITNSVFSGGNTIINVAFEDSGAILPDPITEVLASVITEDAGNLLRIDITSESKVPLPGTGTANLVTDGGFENGNPDLYRRNGGGAGPDAWAITEQPANGKFAMTYDNTGQTGAAVLTANSSNELTDPTGHAQVGRRDYVFTLDYRYRGVAPTTGAIKFIVQYRDATGAITLTRSEVMPDPTLSYVTHEAILDANTVAASQYVVFSIEVADVPEATLFDFDNWDVREKVNTELSSGAATGRWSGSGAPDLQLFSGGADYGDPDVDDDGWKDIVSIEDIEIVGGPTGEPTNVIFTASLYAYVHEIYAEALDSASLLAPTIQFRYRWNTTTIFTSTPQSLILLGDLGFPLPPFTYVASPAQNVSVKLQARWLRPLYNAGTVSFSNTSTTVDGVGTRWRDFAEKLFGAAAFDGSSALQFQALEGGDQTIHDISAVVDNGELTVTPAMTSDETDITYKLTYDPGESPPGIPGPDILVRQSDLLVVELRR